MEQMDKMEDVQMRLTTLREDPGITSRMRTHLRRLIVAELRGLPRMQLPPPLSVRARAVACLLVEWLQSYNCHYALSVLVSELPGLADLPRLAGRGDAGKFEVNEVEEILSALDMKSNEISDIYFSSEDNLLKCLLKVVSEWKARLEFKELDVGPKFDNRARADKLKTILSAACVKPENLQFLFSAVNKLIDDEVAETVESEQRNLRPFLAEQEEKFKQWYRDQEELLKRRLILAEEKFNKYKEKVEAEVLAKEVSAQKMLDDVRQQHELVLRNLSALEIKSKKLENDKKAFEEKVKNSLKKPPPPQIVYKIHSSVLSTTSADSTDVETPWDELSKLRKEAKIAKEELSQKRLESETSQESFSPKIVLKETIAPKYSHFRHARQRFSHLLTESRDPPRRTTKSEFEARRELLKKSRELDQLLTTVRCPSSQSSPRSINEIREELKEMKLGILLKYVRTAVQTEKPETKEKHVSEPPQILPPLPDISEILKVHKNVPEVPKGAVQLALDDVSVLSDGEITTGRMSPISNNFWT